MPAPVVGATELESTAASAVTGTLGGIVVLTCAPF